jgi:hypothetical protein
VAPPGAGGDRDALVVDRAWHVCVLVHIHTWLVHSMQGFCSFIG